MPNGIEAPRSWTPEVDLTTWAPGAQRATIVIDAIGEEALATFVDDSGYHAQNADLRSTPLQYTISNHLVPRFLAAAAAAWAARSGERSLAVFWGQRPVPVGDPVERITQRGVSWPPPPPPPPVPFADPSLYMMLTTAHLQMLAVSEHTALQTGGPRGEPITPPDDPAPTREASRARNMAQRAPRGRSSNGAPAARGRSARPTRSTRPRR
jgi:hypothetical protein